ncbi:OLC1v1012671C4 [Oldenlandia corymbosa var. corymbosa]|uniref:OLC1v1012671C4 n=1 Tax=Oldenlandia corymbosa var. corymbosa TaxID=529605 RepID=A0AAV1DWN2_OLDCO|nr:OLC1v1012671C4 [Oldenlandia corymbosa var. corymbosa]
MEVSPKEKSSASANVSRSTTKLLRYPLRSSTKPKDDKQPLGDSSNSALTRSRGRAVADVSKSVGLLDLSGKNKEKSVKPPRRLSIPAKSSASPAPKPLGSVTPVSEVRSRKSCGNLGRTGTPHPAASKSFLARKFNGLTSASYWQSLIKLSESAARHSVSLGFFKLALEFGCEPLQLLRDELKLYIRHHDLAEFEDTIKELREGYNILENTEQLQVSETCSHNPEEIRSSDDDVRSASSVRTSQELKLKPSNDSSPGNNQVRNAKKEATRKNDSATRVRGSVTKDAVKPKPTVGPVVGKPQSRMQKTQKQEPKDSKMKKQTKESSDAQGPLNSPPVENELQENKENMDAVLSEEMTVSDIGQA